MATHSMFLPGESHGQRSLVSCSSRGSKESDITEQPIHARTVPFYILSILNSNFSLKRKKKRILNSWLLVRIIKIVKKVNVS